MTIILFILLFISNFISSYAGRFTEDERIEYFKAHHTWPPSWHNESEGYKGAFFINTFLENRVCQMSMTDVFKALMREQEKEIMQLTGSQERWENWMQFVHGQLVPKFTKYGFEASVQVTLIYITSNKIS